MSLSKNSPSAKGVDMRMRLLELLPSFASLFKKIGEAVDRTEVQLTKKFSVEKNIHDGLLLKKSIGWL